MFLTNSNNGGTGCQRCHRTPEFDIDPDSNNKRVVVVFANAQVIDISVTQAPSLGDLVDPQVVIYGDIMRDPSIIMVREAIDHYDDIEIMNWNTNLDNRLRGGRESKREILIISKQAKVDLEAFLLTPTGYDIHTNEMWSDPFDELGNLMLLLIIISKAEYVLTTDGI